MTDHIAFLISVGIGSFTLSFALGRFAPWVIQKCTKHPWLWLVYAVMNAVGIILVYALVMAMGGHNV